MLLCANSMIFFVKFGYSRRSWQKRQNQAWTMWFPKVSQTFEAWTVWFSKKTNFGCPRNFWKSHYSYLIFSFLPWAPRISKLHKILHSVHVQEHLTPQNCFGIFKTSFYFKLPYCSGPGSSEPGSQIAALHIDRLSALPSDIYKNVRSVLLMDVKRKFSWYIHVMVDRSYA